MRLRLPRVRREALTTRDTSIRTFALLCEVVRSAMCDVVRRRIALLIQLRGVRFVAREHKDLEEVSHKSPMWRSQSLTECARRRSRLACTTST